MDFFQAQEAARTRSRTLVALFIGAVAAIIASVYALVHVVMGPGPGGPIDPGLLLVVAVGTVVIVASGSAYRTAELRRGGSAVAEMLGGRRIHGDTQDEHERRLVNVVEEMAIASGTPVPAIYVLDNEGGINAFAAGHTLDDAAVAVTRGTLETLNRDELQGVVAHEFSHILNGDMRLNVRLIGLLFGILLLAVVGRGMLRVGHLSGGGRQRGKGSGGGQAALIGLGLILVGYVGVFFGRLIQAAVSRQREFLADASAVQFTRNPDGIGGALRKIEAMSSGSKLDNHHAAEASHMFFANGLSGALFSAMATHPPLSERMRRVTGQVLERPRARDLSRTDSGRGAAVPGLSAAGAAASGFGASAFDASGFDASGLDARDFGAARNQGATSPEPTARSDHLVGSIGRITADSVAAASRLLATIPEALRDAAHTDAGAQALLFALLLERDHAAGVQRDLLVAFEGESLVGEVERLRAVLEGLGHSARLSLLDMLIPALKELSPARRHAVRELAEQLIRADGRTEMFELAAYHVLRRHLEPEEDAADAASAKVHSIREVRAEADIVFRAIARSGTADASVADQSFSAAVAKAGLDRGSTAAAKQSGSERAAGPEASSTSAEAIDRALDVLRTTSPPVRRQIMEGCVAAIEHDGRISPREEVLLRAVGEALGCPVPL